MNYFKVLCALDDFFTREGVRYAVVGAFALHAYGLTRATADLDLVSESRGQSRTLAFLQGLGYEALERYGLGARFREIEEGMGSRGS